MKNRMYNLLYSSLGYGAMCLLKRDQIEDIAKNRKFKDIHKGERCFILGNGPSLNELKFSDLKSEYVFTVNQLARRPDYCQLNANYHIWSDFNFFKVDPDRAEDLELVNTMIAVNTGDNHPECFFPVDVKPVLEELGVANKVNANYFKIHTKLYEGFHEKTDFTRLLPGLSTVVQYAILLAVYMGFSEIILLGVDTTQIMVQIKSYLKCNDQSDYMYTLTDNEKKRMERQLESTSLEEYARSYWHLLFSYRVLYEYCRDKNVKLINCSSVTTIDSIPRGRVEDFVQHH